jgi:hypothetical protein
VKRLICALLLLYAPSLSATDLYICYGINPPPGESCLNPPAALANWKTGDRIWLIGFNFKLLLAWDKNDPTFITPTIPYPNRPDVQIILKPGIQITSVPVTRRKGDTSKTAPITVNKSTTVQVETK